MTKDTDRSALLVMDMQEMILQNIPDNASLIQNVKASIEYAHQYGIPVLYVVVGFRQTMDEINLSNINFTRFAQQRDQISMEKWMKITPEIAPQANEVLVVKKRFSAFAGSDLEMILRSKGIQHLILSGISTSGVVLSTITEAADKDFQLTVLSDCCQDRDPSVHLFLTDKIFPKYGQVMTHINWM
ncbi:MULTISPECIES: cysteine hydrolase family protein [Chitinophagaceae]